MSKPDVIINNQGTLIVFELQSDAVRAWVDEHVTIPSYLWVGSGFACEHRLAADLIQGILSANFEVQ